MSNVIELELEEIDDTSPSAPADLRKYAERMAKKAEGADAVIRENALLRAGIDTGTTLGKAFLATYAGDLKDETAILEAAKEFPGIIRGAPAPAAEDTTDKNQGDSVNQDQNAAAAPTGTDERRSLADGALPTGAVQQDPVEASHERARALLKEGRTREEAMGDSIALQARALNEGRIAGLDGMGRPVQR